MCRVCEREIPHVMRTANQEIVSLHKSSSICFINFTIQVIYKYSPPLSTSLSHCVNSKSIFVEFVLHDSRSIRSVGQVGMGIRLKCARTCISCGAFSCMSKRNWEIYKSHIRFFKATNSDRIDSGN